MLNLADTDGARDRVLFALSRHLVTMEALMRWVADMKLLQVRLSTATESDHWSL
jgi:hypothetical protein